MKRLLLTDQNFNAHIVDAMRRIDPMTMCYSVRDFGLARAEDAEVIAFAATHDFIFLSHDTRTIPPVWYERLGTGLAVPFIFLVPERYPIGRAAQELTAALTATAEYDGEPTLIRLPLR